MSFKITFSFSSPIKITKQKVAFTSWKDAVPYLGKECVVNIVEDADVVGVLTGITLIGSGDKITGALLSIKGTKWDFYRCRPAK